MERNEVSIHEAKLFLALQKRGQSWATSKELAKHGGVAERTARAHLSQLSAMGIAECAEVFPGYRYRLAKKTDKQNGDYLRRLNAACKVFGI